MKSRKITFKSHLQPDECCRRLKASLKKTILPIPDSKPIQGKVKKNRIMIRKNILGMNSFSEWFKGEISRNDNVTELSGNFGTHPGIIAVMFFL